MSQPQPLRVPTEVVVTQEGSSSELDASSAKDPPEKPLPLRAVLTRPVLISIANYAMLALLGMAALALIPLIWSTSVEFGGLDLNPASIGLWMSTYGCMDGMFQFAIAPYAIARFGPRRVFIASHRRLCRDLHHVPAREPCPAPYTLFRRPYRCGDMVPNSRAACIAEHP